MIYFDNASSTKVDYKVIRKINKNYKYYYNQNSITNFEGKLNNKRFEKYRKKISKILKCKKSEFFFTNSSTISNNLILNGFLNKNKKYSVVTTKTEHLSIINTIKHLKNKKLFFKCLKNGKYDLNDLKKKLNNNKKILLAITYVNNETGVIQDIKNILKLKKKYNFLIFIDCCQALGKIIKNIKNINAEFISLSSNKIHGPKGISGLYIKNKFLKKIEPTIRGGEQEKKIYSGTICLSLVSGFLEALIIQNEYFELNKKYIKNINNYFIKKLKKNNFLKINSTYNKSPYIINFYIKNISSQIYKKYLKDFFFTNSSSCLSIKKKSSYVLKAMKKKKFICENSIRISFSKYNKLNEIKKFYRSIKKMVNLFYIIK
ncbi:aminotransferase class V-fold PLP-dependent enzyme [Candidatus Vidania fulgoroideorum]